MMTMLCSILHRKESPMSVALGRHLNKLPSSPPTSQSTPITVIHKPQALRKQLRELYRRPLGQPTPLDIAIIAAEQRHLATWEQVRRLSYQRRTFLRKFEQTGDMQAKELADEITQRIEKLTK